MLTVNSGNIWKFSIAQNNSVDLQSSSNEEIPQHTFSTKVKNKQKSWINKS